MHHTISLVGAHIHSRNSLTHCGRKCVRTCSTMYSKHARTYATRVCHTQKYPIHVDGKRVEGGGGGCGELGRTRERERLTERERHWSSSSSGSNTFRCRAHAEALGTRRESVAFWHLLISPITSTNSTEHHNACVCGDQTSENTHTGVGAPTEYRDTVFAQWVTFIDARSA